MTVIDGGGVVHDFPLPDGTRIRFRLGSSGRHDVTVYVENGTLQVIGSYLPLSAIVIEKNHLEISVAELGADCA